jgi:ubiquinone/menaquinone biosynthesis C-methylase UbiE
VTTTNSSETTTGLRSVLSLAPAYRFVQRAIGADRFRDVVVAEIIQPVATDRVLDAGCGTGDIVAHFPDVDHYLGFDPSPEYVEAARQRFGTRASFVQADVGSFPHAEAGRRSLMIAIGVLHHLDDDAVDEMLELARRVLEPGGRFVSIDPTLTPDQHPIARLLVKSDRGRHVRTPDQMGAIVARHFEDGRVSTRDDLLRPPYTHVIVRAVRR